MSAAILASIPGWWPNTPITSWRWTPTNVVIDRLYYALKNEGHSTILPLVADVADPSPGLG